ncbi:hypothetical protein MMC22_006002 [Lobaria immixta]|nr:hypothetical protein [Lobaria immixta]
MTENVYPIVFTDEPKSRPLFEQRDLLQSDESRRVVNLIEDDMSSLRWLRDENSQYSRKSTMAEDSQTLDKNFEFNRGIFSSMAYRAAMRSTMRQALSGKADKMAQCESSTLSTLPGSFIRDNNEEILTIRKERFSPFLSEDTPVKQGELRSSSFRSGSGKLRPNVLDINISKEISMNSQAVPAVMRETKDSSPYNILSLDNNVASKGVCNGTLQITVACLRHLSSHDCASALDSAVSDYPNPIGQPYAYAQTVLSLSI